MLRTFPNLLCALLLATSPASALGKPEWDLELDAYYSALALNLPFRHGALEEGSEKDEILTYRGMVSRAFIPSYLVLEASVNPMPVAGTLLRRNWSGLYRGAQTSDSVNLVQAVTAGFEEPYAFSLFLGKVTDFDPGKSTLKRSRKGYVGYLASAGNYHIMSNIMVPDNWLETEWKIKGDQVTERRKMSWSFRGGRKFHANREIRDAFHLGIRRSRTDYERTKNSFWLSSAVDYRVDFDGRGLDPMSHFLLIEKNFPLKKRWTFSLGVGYLWQGQEKYSGSLARRRRPSESQILLRPNIAF